MKLIGYRGGTVMKHFLTAIISFSFLLAGCGGEGSAGKEQDYEQTKQMVVDILKTSEGQKALQETLQQEEMKQQLVLASDTVKEAITEAFQSDAGIEMWKKLFEDPEFVKTFAASMSEEQKELFKGLMHDADFQKKLLELLQNPELAEQTLTLLKSQQFREHLEKTIQETLDSPLYKAKIEDILIKAAEKKQKEADAEKNEG